MTLSIAQLNGRTASVEDLAPLAFAGYAHFTAMQVRDRAVRGLDLHLHRLSTASDELFGHHLPDAKVTEYLRIAIEAGGPDASLTCYLSSRPGEFLPSHESATIDVLIKVSDPVVAPRGPLSVDAVEHERYLPHLKHVGEIAKTHFLRQAQARGFDDAAFEDRSGRLSEATIWNLALWDGASVLWPDAAHLPGVTMRILRRRLRARGVPQASRVMRRSDLNDGLAAVVMNSWSPGIPLARIGGQELNLDPTFPRLLAEAYAEEAPTRP